MTIYYRKRDLLVRHEFLASRNRTPSLARQWWRTGNLLPGEHPILRYDSIGIPHVASHSRFYLISCGGGVQAPFKARIAGLLYASVRRRSSRRRRNPIRIRLAGMAQ